MDSANSFYRGTLEEQNLKTAKANQTSDQNMTVTRFVRTKIFREVFSHGYEQPGSASHCFHGELMESVGRELSLLWGLKTVT
ncbi:uncharacterized protein [Scyliorhinus torazame]|uniref:uncharacterized protein isoform X2 n=1 Tax=Scyliorhinus torazame TaxID=75743 RepID=UPI003B5BA7E9